MKFSELEPHYTMEQGQKVLKFRCPLHPEHRFSLTLNDWSISSEFATMTIMPAVHSKRADQGCGAHFFVVGGLIYL